MLTGINHPQWKGDKASYYAIHIHVRRYNPRPEQCQDCDIITNRLELANVTGIYNRDIKNYRYLCHSCHMKFDAHKHRKDMSDRICSNCGSNTTYVKRNGWIVWNHVNNELMCGRCYRDYRRKLYGR